MIAAEHGDGLPLIAVHGFGVDHRIMLPLEEMLATAPWRRIYIDLPWAEGAVDTGAATPREIADAVLTEVADIADGGQFAIVGSSFGAMVARHIAHELPGQCVGLATLAGAFELDRARRRLPPREVLVYDEVILERAGEWRDSFSEMAVIHTMETLAAFEEYALPGLRGADLRVLARLSASYADAYTPEREHHAGFTAPSLHVFGRQDHVVGFEDGLAHVGYYARGSFVVLDGAGHNLQLERPQAVGELMRDWLDRILRT